MQDVTTVKHVCQNFPSQLVPCVHGEKMLPAKWALERPLQHGLWYGTFSIASDSSLGKP